MRIAKTRFVRGETDHIVMKISVILPAQNEAASLARLLPKIQSLHQGSEIIVVDDGSTDDTADIARAQGAQVVSHPYSLRNGAAVKSGARIATGQILVFMDADGQHDPADIPRLLAPIADGYDMVIGARDAESQAGFGRWVANGLYNRLASLMTGHRVADLTSGFRAVRAERFRDFLSLLPNE